ncbi:MAG: hypothetical protein ACRD2X_18605 [Vicinamibacteraceae bacterium]
MSRFTLLALAASAVLFLTDPAASQGQHFPLESADGLELQNVTAEPATLQGKKGLQITVSEEALRRLKENAPEAGPATAQLARIEGVEFSNGTIEAEIAGAPAPGAAEGARGFVGIGFRLQDDNRTYDEFYLRPTNGRAEDQERRNHSVQYVQHPDWPWVRLRKETPSKYETYVDLVPGQWTKVKIEVSGERARLYVHDSEQPTLIVNDVKSGANAKGGIALCIGPGTVAHFRNLTVTGHVGDTASSR